MLYIYIYTVYYMYIYITLYICNGKNNVEDDDQHMNNME